MAPATAALLARELGRDDAWQRNQVATFEMVARGYMVAAE
jgi:glycerol-3-phosphate dehydrogenase